MADGVTVTRSPTEASVIPDGEILSAEELTSINGEVVTAQKAGRAILSLRTANATAVDVTSADPLPVSLSGVATAANQATANTALAAIETAVEGTLTVQGTVAVTGVATAANQTTELAHLAAIETAVEGTLTVGLPTGAATAANQGTANTALSAIQTAVEVIDNAIAGSEMQVDVVSSALPSGASTAAKQPALGTAGTASADVLTVQGIASMTALKVDGSAVTQPISAASLPLPTSAATEAKQDTGNTALSAIQTAVQLIDNAVSGSELQVDVVAALPAGTNNIGDVDVLTLPALPAGTNNIGDVDVASIAAGDNNIGNVDVVTLPALPAGTNNIGDVDVLTLPSIPAGTNNIGDVDVLSLPALAAGTNLIGAVNVKPATTGGLTTYHLVSAGSTNLVNVKASAGQLFGYYIYNSNAAARKVAFHNSASAPTAGASIFFSIVIPATSAANVEFTNGIAFSSGISISTVTGLADNDTAAVAANDLIINLFYS
jgi:hypothetical protein